MDEERRLTVILPLRLQIASFFLVIAWMIGWDIWWIWKAGLIVPAWFVVHGFIFVVWVTDDGPEHYSIIERGESVN